MGLGWIAALFAAGSLVHAQQAERALEMQQQSVERQRNSVLRQVQAVEANGRLAVHGRVAERLPEAAPLTRPQNFDLTTCEPLPSDGINDLVREFAARERLAPELLRAVVLRESGGNPCAVSPKGALGLMQLMPATAIDLGVEDPFDPVENIGGGARFLRSLLERYNDDVALALSAYNAGPGRVKNSVPEIEETRRYVDSILRAVGRPLVTAWESPGPP